MSSTPNPIVGDIPTKYRPFIIGPNSDKEFDALRGRLPGLRAHLPFNSISMRRTPCFGTCPVYEIAFHRDGRAELYALAHLPKLGHFVGQVEESDYARLCHLVESSRFSGFRSSYRARHTDDSTCIVTVTTGDTSTKVSDYGSVGPTQLWAIQQAIDAVKNDIEWRIAK